MCYHSARPTAPKLQILTLDAPSAYTGTILSVHYSRSISRTPGCRFRSTKRHPTPAVWPRNFEPHQNPADAKRSPQFPTPLEPVASSPQSQPSQTLAQNLIPNSGRIAGSSRRGLGPVEIGEERCRFKGYYALLLLLFSCFFFSEQFFGCVTSIGQSQGA